ncbi:protocatechuate 3,4-dioxygenase [Ruegeria arenilitoris]|uniref:protocatechuate 3,4-dioxygenase n=1 Tax=Ruegeria arenilitoris TaxID=1173585 RepID=UPI001CFC6E1D|nr:protocatechuate 3,4-dioxygenase [Ruegeria arenilitoris]
MKASKSTRRNLLTGFAAVAGGVFFLRRADAAEMTPRAAEGPFYPTPSMRMPDVDNDLVKVMGRVEEAGGEVITLRGRITDRNGAPRLGHRIEIWQCDLNGKYLHPGDGRNVVYDRGFQGFGHDITDEDGRYSFRTIKPGKYPGRTPHIHVKVLDGDTELLTTQFYAADEPENKRDSLYRRLSDEQAECVSMFFVETNSGIETEINLQV